MNGSRGKLTQPLRPVGRYRPGKAPVPVASDDDSDEEEQQQQVEGEGGADQDEADEQVQEFSATRRDTAPAGRINVALREVEVDKAGKVKVGGKDEVGRTEMESSEGEYGMSSPSLHSVSLVSTRRVLTFGSRFLPSTLLLFCRDGQRGRTRCCTYKADFPTTSFRCR